MVHRAVESGDYTSTSKIALEMGLTPTGLYHFMKRGGGLNPGNAKRLATMLKKYRMAEPEPQSELKISPLKTNGHANGTSTNGHGHLKSTPPLAEVVLQKLLDVRMQSTNEVLRTRIDNTLARWGMEGLEILADGAIGGP
jgi:hypothetical protein